MEFFNDHRKLFTTAFLMFALLTWVVAIIPSLDNQENNAPLPGTEKLSGSALRGKDLYISNGCVACHTQQVRNIDMDKGWGERPSIAADYAHVERTSFWKNSATLMGTERTGPDLTNIGSRQPSKEWHLMHLYNPRIVISQSIMPAYPWLFNVKEKVEQGDHVIEVPDQFRNGNNNKIVATQDALDLVAYLQSLKQALLPGTITSPNFLYKKEKVSESNSVAESKELDGEALYVQNCQSCHQSNGEGLKGAFPPLKGSGIVLSNDPSLMVAVIMKGYDAREEFGVMPAVGTNNKLTAEEIAAIMNHERTSWGNNARKVSSDEVRKIILQLDSTFTNN